MALEMDIAHIKIISSCTIETTGTLIVSLLIWRGGFLLVGKLDPEGAERLPTGEVGGVDEEFSFGTGVRRGVRVKN
jgi:hypothetical protein